MARFTAQLIFLDRTVAIEVDPGETILEAARRQGVFLLSDCTLGVCGTCKALRSEGQSEMEIDPQALTILEAKRGYVLTCQSYPRSDLSLQFGYESARARRSEQRTVQAALVENAFVAESVVRVRLGTAGGEVFRFRPGQYVNITVPGTSERRSFSFANEPESGSDPEFFVRILADGLMSNYLRDRARPGDCLELAGPFGEFYLREPRRPILMVAGGTGLAPMLSMLGHLAVSGGGSPPIYLLYGVNRRSELFGIERLEEYRRALGHFRYELAVAFPESDWRGSRGFVTDLLREDLLAPAGLDAYLCGPPPMIEAATAWLASRGVPAEDIHSEKFSPSGLRSA
jgi:anthranilate 1,2-dioxygenase reductase subunit